MDKKIFQQSKRKLQKLSKKYDGFINIILDDWRGYRLIYDTKETRSCKNNCGECKLFNLLKNETSKKTIAGLHLASETDKKLFGNQRYLNCKTTTQYRSCYVNYITKKIKKETDLTDELNLLMNLEIIYSKNGITITGFQDQVISAVIERGNDKIKRWVLKYQSK